MLKLLFSPDNGLKTCSNCNLLARKLCITVVPPPEDKDLVCSSSTRSFHLHWSLISLCNLPHTNRGRIRYASRTVCIRQCHPYSSANSIVQLNDVIFMHLLGLQTNGTWPGIVPCRSMSVLVFYYACNDSLTVVCDVYSHFADRIQIMLKFCPRSLTCSLPPNPRSYSPR